MLKIVLAILLSFKPWHGDLEEAEARKERLATIALAISEASSGDQEVAAFLTMTAKQESDLAKHIHEGNCRKSECDGGRAVSLWQLHRSGNIPQADWEAMKGTSPEATLKAAKAAASLYRGARDTCRSVRGAISLYATGRTCSWEGASAREALMQKYLGKF